MEVYCDLDFDVRSGGATAHPTRQPVTLKLFPPLPMVTVLSYISDRDAENHTQVPR